MTPQEEKNKALEESGAYEAKSATITINVDAQGIWQTIKVDKVAYRRSKS